MTWTKPLRVALFTLLLLVILPSCASAQPGPDMAPGPALPDLAIEPAPAMANPVADVPLEVNRDPDGAFAGRFGPMSMADPIIGQARIRTDYRATWYPEESVAGQPTRLGYEQQDFLLSVPVWQNCANEWTASLNVRNDWFQTHAFLPSTGQAFPNELWSIRFSSNYRHLFDNGWIWGGAISVGTASDKPFHSIDEMTVGFNTFLRIPQGEHNAWIFTLSYSPTGELAFPIPGVAFIWQPSDHLRINIGLPFAVMYRPLDDLTLDFSYMLLLNIRARATYRVYGPLRIYVGYEYSNEGYFLADRVDVDDRFFIYDQRAVAGAQAVLNKHVMFDLSTGYVFGRFFYEGRSLSDRNTDRVDIGAGPFLSAQVRIRW